ncbi:MAG TPA: endonuclease III domain-containing protein, partial [Pyrinomonadaceae bacterium]
MSTVPPTIQELAQALECHYGKPSLPRIKDPFSLIIHENIGYLVSDEKRDAAFAILKSTVGLKPKDILIAPMETLVQITKLGGIHAELRAARLQEIAQIVLNDFSGDLNNVIRTTPAMAIKELKKFPSIGTPGAEKILLFTRAHPILALDSNGLRVLLRLGFGVEAKSYSASYNSVRAAIKDDVCLDYDFLISAHLLLRKHGKELCRTNNPACPK